MADVSTFTVMTAPPERPQGRDALGFVAVAALWLATVGNWPLWRQLTRLPELDSTQGTIFLVGFGLMLTALFSGLLSLAAWRHTIKPAIAVLVVSAAIAAYFMGAYSVVLDPSMMNNVLQTDPGEVADLLGFGLVANLAVIAGVPLIALWRARVRRRSIGAQAWRNGLAFVVSLGVFATLLLVFFAEMSATMRSHRSLRYLINPVNAYYSLGVLAVQSQARPAGPLQPIGGDSRIADRPPGALPPLLVLVVGETARADHFALNGYRRPTNPGLSQADVVSFTDVTACGTNTAASLPCMFSHLGRAGYQARERDHENLLDLAQKAGLAVLWVDNQSGCKGLCDRVPHAEARAAAPGAAPPPAALCPQGECLDEALLHNLEVRVAALPEERRQRGVLVVLHQMGSHGPAYFRRSPPHRKPFQPECSTTVLQQCARAELVNAYDNSIAYTDHVLADTIRWLAGRSVQYRPALLYISDHGESLGENNLYLHGMPYAIAPAEQKHVPMVAWFAADGGAAGVSATVACLRQRRAVPLSHDHLFHTTLGILGVQAREYDRKLDAFAACRLP